MMKRSLLAGLIFCALVIPLPAAMVSFLVIETGLPESSGSNSWSGLWESGLLDVFFEEGHIVSNAPIKRLGRTSQNPLPEEVQAEFDEAAAGGADYFILALLDYPPPTGKEIPRPRNAVLRLFRIKPCRLLYEEGYAAGTALNITDEWTAIKQSVRELVPHLEDQSTNPP
jgi:hypothetical protein